MANDQHGRPIREVPNDTTNEELAAGHLIPGANPPRNEAARGGFGNRDGKQGYGTDSEDGSTATSVNENADAVGHPADNMRTTAEGRPAVGANEDVAAADLDSYAATAELRANHDETAPRRHPISDTGPSGEAEPASALTEDGNNVRPDARISGQDMTFEELARSGTNAELTDPDARDSGIATGA